MEEEKKTKKSTNTVKTTAKKPRTAKKTASASKTPSSKKTNTRKTKEVKETVPSASDFKLVDEEAKPLEKVVETPASVLDEPESKEALKAKFEVVDEEPTDLEKVVEEVKEDETKPALETVIEGTEVLPLENKETFVADIEKRRSDLSHIYKVNKRVSNIISLVVICVIVAAFLLISQKNDTMKIIGYVLAGAALATMLIYYVVGKNKLPNATKEYINHIKGQFISYTFDEEQYTKITTNPDEKLELGDVVGDDLYKNVSRIVSRNIVRGLSDDKRFMSSELAIYSPTEKKKEKTLFVGKYISCYNTLKFEGKILIVHKSKDNVDLSNNLEGLEVVKDNDNYTVYSTPGLNFDKVIDHKDLNELCSFSGSEHLLNQQIVIWQGHTAAYLSYDDATMVYPFEKEFVVEPLASYKKEQAELLRLLNKFDK